MGSRLAAATAAVLLAACGDAPDDDAPPASEQADDGAIAAYYAAQPAFFGFKTLADLPPDLLWQDGSDLPDIGSREAVKGGTEYGAIQDFPRTLRTVGPDSNGSFRPWLLDDTTMALGHRHPDEFAPYPGLAAAWAVSAAERTVYVRLAPEARWSDGEPITADDFLYAFYFFQSPHIVAPWYNNWYGTQFANITRYDDHTLSVKVPRPSRTWTCGCSA